MVQNEMDHIEEINERIGQLATITALLQHAFESPANASPDCAAAMGHLANSLYDYQKEISQLIEQLGSDQ